MICQECGSDNYLEGSMFCFVCGSMLSDSVVLSDEVVSTPEKLLTMDRLELPYKSGGFMLESLVSTDGKMELYTGRAVKDLFKTQTVLIRRAPLPLPVKDFTLHYGYSFRVLQFFANQSIFATIPIKSFWIDQYCSYSVYRKADMPDGLTLRWLMANDRGHINTSFIYNFAMSLCCILKKYHPNTIWAGLDASSIMFIPGRKTFCIMDYPFGMLIKDRLLPAEMMDYANFTTFVAPEISRGTGIFPTSDVYSLGHIMDALWNVKSGKSRNDEAFTLIIRKACAEKLDNRLSSVDAMMMDLHLYRKQVEMRIRPVLNNFDRDAEGETRLFD